MRRKAACWITEAGLEPTAAAVADLKEQMHRRSAVKCACIFGDKGQFVVRSSKTGVKQSKDLGCLLRTALPISDLRGGLLSRIVTEHGAVTIALTDITAMSWTDAIEAQADTHIVSRLIDMAWLRSRVAAIENRSVRRALAGDLHDNIAQSLAGTRFWLSVVRTFGATRGVD